MEYKSKMPKYIDMIEAALESYVPEKEVLHKTVYKAMRYSLLAGGKRLRPVMTLEFCRMSGGDPTDALPVACAVEMIHSYSLIHDDLPCMDNDDYRRGRPTSHKVFGEAVAVLAGDALLNAAFETVLNHTDFKKVPAERLLLALEALAAASGSDGMIGGQIIDMESENKEISMEELLMLQQLKTGAMFGAAVKTGCIIAGAEDRLIEAAASYAGCIGLAFQIQDDILDVEGDANLLGKATGSDAAGNKATFVTCLGLEKAKQKAKDLTNEAIGFLAPFDDRQMIVELSLGLMNRKK